MNITKGLKRNGKLFAVMLHDHELEYPVFLETLANTVYLDSLLESGWKLVSLPYGLVKDGIGLEDLPVEEFNPTPAEEQEMWDMIGTPLSQEELKARLSPEDAKYLKLPKGQYRITTRADFLKYLEVLEANEQTEDFLPINYFVHPSVLFSYDEYTDPKNSRYVEIMANRRTMSLPKFKMLVNWALYMGLKPDFTPLDLISFYFQWGIDGLNVPFISKHREQRYVTLGAPLVSPDQAELVAVKKKEYGIIDRWGDVKLPDEAYIGNSRWQPATSQKSLEELRSNLKDDEVAVVEYRAPSSEEVEVIETLATTITYDANRMIIGGRRQRTITVRSFHGAGAIHSRFWNPSMEEELNNDMYLKAIAKDLVDKLTDRADVSSYRALLESGCSPLSAMLYVVTEMGVEAPTDKIQEEASVIVTHQDVIDYCKDTLNEPAKVEILDNIVDGVSNIDSTQSGARRDMDADPSRYYLSFYVAHKVLGLSPEEIHQAVKKLDEDADTLVLSGKGKELPIKLIKVDAMHNGYKTDKTVYHRRQAETAEEIVYIDTIARELGGPNASKHVAVGMYMFRNLGKAKKIMDELAEIYKEAVADYVVGMQKQQSYLNATMLWTTRTFFDIALKGAYTLPEGFGGTLAERFRMATPEMKQACASCLEYCIEDTVSYCDTMVYQEGPSDTNLHGCFLRHCVNAIVTPERVYPRKNFFIREVSLAALWPDYSRQPAIQSALLQNGILTPNHVCWDSLFANNQTLCNHELGATGLDAYYDRAEKERTLYPTSKEFVAVTHIMQTQHPKFFDEEAQPEVPTLAEPREGAPAFKIGAVKNLQGTVADPFEDSVEQAARKESDPIQPFYGLSADDFYFTHGKVNIPVGQRPKHITVVDGTHIYIEDRGIVSYDTVENLNADEYSIALICGRKYILRDAAGKYWTVSI